MYVETIMLIFDMLLSSISIAAKSASLTADGRKSPRPVLLDGEATSNVNGFLLPTEGRQYELGNGASYLAWGTGVGGGGILLSLIDALVIGLEFWDMEMIQCKAESFYHKRVEIPIPESIGLIYIIRCNFMVNLSFNWSGSLLGRQWGMGW